MRILVLSINYAPEDTGIAVFSTGRAEWLAGRGHEVTVCTGFPYYPWWRVPDAYRGRLLQRERIRGVDVRRSWLYVPRRVTSVRRIVHEASFLASSCLRALAGRAPELIFVISPPLGLGLVALLLSRAWGVPYVFHVADLQPDAAVDLGMLPRGGLIRALYAVEAAAYRHAALVSTLTEAMRARIVAKGTEAGKVRLFPDWVDPTLFTVGDRADDARAFRARHGLGDRFLVVHAGNIGVKQGLDVVLDAAALARDRDDLAFWLVGDGAVRSALEERLRRLALRNCRILPLLPRDDFRALLAATDVALVTQQRVVADVVFPSKVLTLLAAGRPVVASVNPGSEVARVVRDAGAGLVPAPESAPALLDAVLALQRDPALRVRSGVQGRAFARARWDCDVILPRMEAELTGLVSSRQRVGAVGPATAAGTPPPNPVAPDEGHA